MSDNSPQVNWTLVKAGDGQSWRGIITLPAAPGVSPSPGPKGLKITGKKAATREKALANAANAALRALENPIVKSILPPGTGLAISAVKALANPKSIKAVAKYGKKALGKIASVFR